MEDAVIAPRKKRSVMRERERETSPNCFELDADADFIANDLFHDGPPIIVNESGISLSYAIAGKSSIASDSSWHRVSIAVCGFNTL